MKPTYKPGHAGALSNGRGLGAHRKNCLSQPVHSRLYTKAVKLNPITFHQSSDTTANLTKPAPKGIK